MRMMERKLTVGYVPGDGKHYPMIRLQGKWLGEMGFEVGEKVMVVAVIDEGRIVITKIVSQDST